MSDIKTMYPNALLRWRGLGGWNFYFLFKLALLWGGYLNFHPLINLVFLAWLLLPLPSQRWHRCRNWISLPLGAALFYHDTWLPGVSSIISQGGQVTAFSADYLAELAERFINWNMVGMGFVLLVGYLFVAQWLRVTVLVSLALVWLNLLTLTGPSVSLLPQRADAPAASAATGGPSTPVAAQLDDNAPPTNANLTARLARFYEQEKQRVTAFPQALPADAAPFDILVINTCSLAWSDLDAAQLRDHPLWRHFDVLLTNYNSATGYSGPAGIRLLRASCGQSSHDDLYKPAPAQCYLFDNLAKLGFQQELIMDHDGVFGDYLKELQENGNLRAPLMSQAGIAPKLTSFDGSPIFDDAAVLQRWLDDRQKSGDARSATFYNQIALHDGVRNLGGNGIAPYQQRARMLFDKLDAFLTNLDKSGRKVLVLMVPEHGAALTGDNMQIAGLRDIPSPSITHVPVGIKFVGMTAPHPGQPLQIDTPTSLQAISEIVSRTLDGKVFTASSVDLAALLKDLPQTPVVSENESAVVMMYQGKPWIRLNGGDWVAYP